MFSFWGENYSGKEDANKSYGTADLVSGQPNVYSCSDILNKNKCTTYGHYLKWDSVGWYNVAAY